MHAWCDDDENRMVGHYWLRAPELAPGKWGTVIRETLAAIKNFAEQIHQGKIAPERGGKFKNLLLIGIGGSALGPEFVAHALSDPNQDKLTPHFFDNSDPGGMESTLAHIGDELQNTFNHQLEQRSFSHQGPSAFASPFFIPSYYRRK